MCPGICPIHQVAPVTTSSDVEAHHLKCNLFRWQATVQHITTEQIKLYDYAGCS